MSKKIKLNTKITSFPDVEKAFRELEKSINNIIVSSGEKAEVELSNTEGLSGDVRVSSNANRSYSLECRTKDGWGNLYASNVANESGDFEVFVKDKPKFRPTAFVQDETPTNYTTTESDSTFLTRTASYDSGWLTASIDSRISITHNLDISDPTDAIYMIWVANTALSVIYPLGAPAGHTGAGVVLRHVNNNSMYLYTGGSHLFGIGSYFGGANAPPDVASLGTPGKVRVKIWK